MGKIYAPVSGPYKFTAVVDDGIRIWVNGKLAMDEWRYQKKKLAGQSVKLQAGKFYDLKIEYYNARNGGYVQLNWNLVNESGKTPAFEDSPQQKIDARFLYSGPARLKPATPTKPLALTPVGTTPKKLPIMSQKTIVALSKPPGKSVGKPKPVQPVVNVTKPTAPPVSISVVEAVGAPELIINKPVVFGEIAFVQSDYQLLSTAYEALNELASTLERDTTIRLEIAGHTDNVGDPRLNKALSENRAKVVRNYLIRRSVAEHRITIVGYGGTRPIASNKTEIERAKNRRVEFIPRTR